MYRNVSNSLFIQISLLIVKQVLPMKHTTFWTTRTIDIHDSPAPLDPQGQCGKLQLDLEQTARGTKECRSFGYSRHEDDPITTTPLVIRPPPETRHPVALCVTPSGWLNVTGRTIRPEPSGSHIDSDHSRLRLLGIRSWFAGSFRWSPSTPCYC